MRVTLIAHTQFNRTKAEWLTDYVWDAEPFIDDADLLSEFAGRACYQSWSKPNPATRSNADYLDNIKTQAHYSVLEHATATFYVEGVSRALTHELIRHRHLSYSQLSQRFVNEQERDYVSPPAFDDSASSTRLHQLLSDVDLIAREAYREIVHILERDGKTRKQAREAARAVLPNATETKIVVTGNIRAWREFIEKRYSPHADAEIREFAGEVLRCLREISPNSVRDLGYGNGGE